MAPLFFELCISVFTSMITIYRSLHQIDCKALFPAVAVKRAKTAPYESTCPIRRSTQYQMIKPSNAASRVIKSAVVVVGLKWIGKWDSCRRFWSVQMVKTT